MKIFISHSSQDKWFADKIVELLEKLNIEFWYDKVNLFIGDNLLRSINTGLDDCSHLIVILSNNSIVSKWVQEEIETFYKKYLEGKKAKVYPLLLEDVWGKAPQFLDKLVYADFRGSTTQQLNSAGLVEVEKELLGVLAHQGDLFKCYHHKNEHRLFVTLPQNKTKKEINEMARDELEILRTKLAGKTVWITGRCTYTLGLMIGAFLGNICNGLFAYDPRTPLDSVPILLPS